MYGDIRYIKTIDLQIQVADFVVSRHELFVSTLEQWNESRGKSSVSSPSRSPAVPTLFASQDVRTDLCCLVTILRHATVVVRVNCCFFRFGIMQCSCNTIVSALMIKF